MNLSPDWILALRGAGHDAVDWGIVGSVDAPDEDILRWARPQDRTILTTDVDFGTLLAISGEPKASVLQLRTGTTLSSRIGL